jgi:hypothetical protein
MNTSTFVGVARTYAANADVLPAAGEKNVRSNLMQYSVQCNSASGAMSIQ